MAGFTLSGIYYSLSPNYNRTDVLEYNTSNSFQYFNYLHYNPGGQEASLAISLSQRKCQRLLMSLSVFARKCNIFQYDLKNINVKMFGPVL